MESLREARRRREADGVAWLLLTHPTVLLRRGFFSNLDSSPPRRISRGVTNAESEFFVFLSECRPGAREEGGYGGGREPCCGVREDGSGGGSQGGGEEPYRRQSGEYEKVA